MHDLTPAQLDDMIATRGALPSIGQITPAAKRHLDRRVKAGELATYRGYWNTCSSCFGIGPLKTIYALPEIAAEQTAMAVFYAERAA